MQSSCDWVIEAGHDHAAGEALVQRRHWYPDDPARPFCAQFVSISDTRPRSPEHHPSVAADAAPQRGEPLFVHQEEIRENEETVIGEVFGEHIFPEIDA